MASTYSNLKIQLMTTGENATTWGNVTNVNLGTALEEAIVGSVDVTFASANVTLTLIDANTTQTARNLRLRLTGTTGGSTRNLVVPSIEKPYIVQNDCADSVLVKTSAGTGITVPAGKTMWVYSDGTNVVDVATYFTSVGTPAVVATDITATNLTAANATFTNATVANFTLSGGLASTNVSSCNITTSNISTSNVAADNTVTDTGAISAVSPGFRGIPNSAQGTGTAITLDVADAGRMVPNTTGGWVIPANASVAFPVNTTIVLYNNSSSNQAISITSDTLRWAGTPLTGSRTLSAYGLATVVKVSSTVWVISGAGLS